MDYVIDEGAKVGHVHLKVSDLDRSIAFYRDVLGFELQQRFGSEGGLPIGRRLPPPRRPQHLDEPRWSARPQGSAGLFHAAFLYPTRAALARAVVRVVEARVPLSGASDHGVSEAVYLADPDQNGIELYWDRPREEWPRPAGGGDGVEMFTQPLDLQDLIAQAKPA